MSVICAAWTKASEPSAQSMVDTMLAAQAMPFDARRYLWHDSQHAHGHVAMGADLLFLLPEDRFDQQPVWNHDHSACLMGDIRLDNRDDLVRELALTQPETLADSAILMQAWQRWGSACLDHILGGFAFVVWTPAKQELFAARDHAGERPLFYHRGQSHGQDFVAIASMPKALLALPGVFRGFNEQRVIDALVLTQPDWSKTYYEGIERLPLGHSLRVTPDGVECRQYWHPSNTKEIRFKRDADYVDAVLEIFDKATAARLRTPRNIGSQLSAGLDSSSVMATAAMLLQKQGRGLTAFTSVPRPGFHGKGLPGRLTDEGPGAAAVAAMYPNVTHMPIHSAGFDLTADIKAWTDAMDEPAQNCVNLLWISAILQQAQQRDIGVMLQGLVGNATLSADGWEAMTAYFRTGHWLKLFRFANNLRNRGEFSFKASFIVATEGITPMWLKRQIKPGIRTFSLDASAANPELIGRYQLAQRIFNKIHGPALDVPTQRARIFERFDHGPLNTATRARYGIDMRDPMGDKRIWEFCFGTPIEQYAAGGQTRSLIRRAMVGRLPEATRTRSIRGQQGADWYLTVEEALPALREEVALEEKSPLVQYFIDVPRLKKLTETWPATGHETAAVTSSWNLALTRGVALGYMLRQRDPNASE